jgi:hypothetical protein
VAGSGRNERREKKRLCLLARKKGRSHPFFRARKQRARNTILHRSHHRIEELESDRVVEEGKAI